MRRFRSSFWSCWLCFSLLPALLSGQESASAPDPKSPLAADQVFFTLPLGQPNPGPNVETAMDLALDYAKIKYPYGMINLLDPKQRPVGYRQRLIINEPEKVSQVEKASGVKLGEKFTLVTLAGKTYTARAASFAYFGNSPSTVLVVANLRLKLSAPDAQVFALPGLALRGIVKLAPNSKVRLWPEEKILPELLEKLRLLAVPPARAGETVSDLRMTPARLESTAELDYFVSYWHHPQGAYDLEDVQSAGYLFQVQGDEIKDLNLPGNLEVKAVWDLTGDGRAEVLGTGGDGAEVCYQLQSWDGKAFALIKQGLCAGY